MITGNGNSAHDVLSQSLPYEQLLGSSFVPCLSESQTPFYNTFPESSSDPNLYSNFCGISDAELLGHQTEPTDNSCEPVNQILPQVNGFNLYQCNEIPDIQSNVSIPKYGVNFSTSNGSQAHSLLSVPSENSPHCSTWTLPTSQSSSAYDCTFRDVMATSSNVNQYQRLSHG